MEIVDTHPPPPTSTNFGVAPAIYLWCLIYSLNLNTLLSWQQHLDVKSL